MSSLQWLTGLAIVFIFLIDRTIKYFLFSHAQFFKNVFVLNEQIAFSLPLSRKLIFATIFLIMIWLFREIVIAGKGKHFCVVIAIASVFFGALSNVTDRIFYGGVIDYVEIFSWYPLFNLADILIVVGIIFWAWFIGKEKFLC